MEQSQQQQQVYFERIADEFDQHYLEQKQKGPWERLIDRIFRQGMVQRYAYVTEKLDWKDQRFLDVGCGPGRYMEVLLRRGAAHAYGLDYAANMIDIARRNLQQAGLIDKCTLAVGDFLTANLDGQAFDTVLAMGYFDYILGAKALDEHFGRMRQLAGRRVVASFPSRWSFKTFPRWMWLSARGCPVQFFSVTDVENMMRRLNVAKFQLIRMSGTILAIAEKE